MTKNELITALAAQKPELSKRDVNLAVKNIITLLYKTVCSGKRIEIRNFGSFSIKIRSAQDKRNPKTGEKIRVPDRNVLRFKPSRKLGAQVKTFQQH
ncbi:HU family DNA-binding protein [Methylomonas sp. AM2-LC]|uniref:HU family DNA-binding protein n=1 Tax=Methylomonas sp. AM2-LC TaxID=3153301 RepID=UPI0032645E5C